VIWRDHAQLERKDGMVLKGVYNEGRSDERDV
jgi:hypothetical protein